MRSVPLPAQLRQEAEVLVPTRLTPWGFGGTVELGANPQVAPGLISGPGRKPSLPATPIDLDGGPPWTTFREVPANY